jgi:ketosteroid isomerase-like protein
MFFLGLWTSIPDAKSAEPAQEVTVNRSANLGRDLEVSKIAAVRAAWISAMNESDIDGLIALATDDIVVVHANGKTAIGIDALRANLTHDFGLFDVEPRDSSAQIIVHDSWAIEFCEVDRMVSAVKSGRRVQTHSKIIAVFSRQSDASWKVARVVGLPG